MSGTTAPATKPTFTQLFGEILSKLEADLPALSGITNLFHKQMDSRVMYDADHKELAEIHEAVLNPPQQQKPANPQAQPSAERVASPLSATPSPSSESVRPTRSMSAPPSPVHEADTAKPEAAQPVAGMGHSGSSEGEHHSEHESETKPIVLTGSVAPAPSPLGSKE